MRVETEAGGTWRLGGTVDSWAKVALGCRGATTQTGVDIAALDHAIAAAEALLGRPLHADCVDDETGDLEPLVIVTDNGPAVGSIAVARWFRAHPHLTHVRTRHKAPETSGVIERWFESLTYERLYRHDIPDGLALVEHVADFLDEFNRIRPHGAIDGQRPCSATYRTPNAQTRPTPELSKNPEPGQSSYITLRDAAAVRAMPSDLNYGRGCLFEERMWSVP